MLNIFSMHQQSFHAFLSLTLTRSPFLPKIANWVLSKQQFASTLFRSAVQEIFVQVSRVYLTPRRGFKYFHDGKF